MLTTTTTRGQVAALSAVFCALTFGAPVSRADLVLFQDFNDSVSLVTTSSRITGSCIGARCSVDIVSPTGFRFDGETGGIPEVGGSLLGDGNNLAEPGGVFIADTIGTQESLPTTDFPFFLVADSDTSPVTCDNPKNEIPSCSMTANGLVQNIASVFWRDPAGDIVTDIVELQSVDTVPEPASLLLLSPVLAALIVRKRKRTEAVN